MKYKYLLIAFALSLCANAHADWFLRGTHNAWAATPMVSGGTNSMQLDGVVFTAAGSIKFDRLGNWSESYGVGGLGGSNIPVAAGTWNIKFFTNTKTWSITAPPVAATYHVRGTHNTWLEGTLMTRVGTTDIYESCVNFTSGDANGGPRFKIDPNGAWGDGIPATDVLVSLGWVKITLNSASSAISTQQNLGANCGAVVASSSVATSSSIVNSSSRVSSSSAVPVVSSSSRISSSSVAPVASSSIQSSIPSSIANSSVVASSSVVPSSIYHVRGTFNGWAEGTLMTRVGTTVSYEKCANFVGGDANGLPRFKIDPNGAWGDGIPAADFVVAVGWVKITFNSTTKVISVQQNLPANCAASVASSSRISSATTASSIAPSSAATVSSSVIASSSSAASPASSIYHVRGSFNGWLEGTLMTRVGTGDSYEKCVNFIGGDATGGPRFKIDPNGAWGGDAVPATDFIVTAGWVKIIFNSVTKAISVQQNLAANCATLSSTGSSIASSSAVSSTSAPASIYHVRGTFNGWLEGVLMNRIGNTAIYEKCLKFPADPLGAKFKIDPNGGWGADVLPSPTAADIAVTAGWVKITLNSTTKAISLTQHLSADCRAVIGSDLSRYSFETTDYYLRSDIDGWGEGVKMTETTGDSSHEFREVCIQVSGAHNFRISARDGKGAEDFPKTLNVSEEFVTQTSFSLNLSGYTYFRYVVSTGEVIDLATHLEANCKYEFATYPGILHYTPVSHFSTTITSAKPYIPVHIRGTHNAWAEGMLMTQVGTTDDYEICLNIPEGDANGGPRFKIDPNGGWGDATADSTVPPGWLMVRYNTTTKQITRRTYLPQNCHMHKYSLAGTHHIHRLNADGQLEWLSGDFFEFIDGDTPEWRICRNFTVGDATGGPRLYIAEDYDDLFYWMTEAGWEQYRIYPVNGWTYVTFTDDRKKPTILTNLGPNCSAP